MMPVTLTLRGPDGMRLWQVAKYTIWQVDDDYRGLFGGRNYV